MGGPVSMVKSVEQPRALEKHPSFVDAYITFIVLMRRCMVTISIVSFELFRLRKEEPHLANHGSNSYTIS